MTGQEGAPDVLSDRALNRALLARQLLLRREAADPALVLEHLVGLQAQNPKDPYYALWTRLEPFRTDDLAALLLSRRAVRLALMRSTIHLVTDRDALALRPALQAVQMRNLLSGSPYGRRLAGIDFEALAQSGRELLEGGALTMAELREGLGPRWPEYDATSLAQAIRNLLPLVQVPPRGVWGVGGQTRLTTTDAWLGRPLAGDASPEPLIRRYLGAFGPASVRDVQVWSGLTRLEGAMEGLRPGLMTFRGARGDLLFDLPEAPRPGAETAAPPRFLPEYDNVLLGHADRSRIVPRELAGRALVPEEHFFGTVLLDGFLGGIWRIARERREATLDVRLFREPAGDDGALLREEAERLLAFGAAEAARRTVRITLTPA